MAVDKLSAMDCEEDDCSAFGNMVAMELRNMNDVEKIIYDAIYLCSMKLVKPTTKLVTDPESPW